MAIDTRSERQSASMFMMPFYPKGVNPGTSGVDQAERQDVTWCYYGLLAGGVAAPTGQPFIKRWGGIKHTITYRRW